jgi:hypothetical protein
MINSTTLFAQVLSLVPRSIFNQAVRDNHAEKGAKGFTCWQQFVAMLFGQFSGSDSLREIACGLKALQGRLSHLGISSPPPYNTLAYANRHRPWQCYRDLFFALLQTLEKTTPPKKHKFRFRNVVLTLDSTLISVALSAFQWAHYRTRKGAVKIHLLLNMAGYFPSWAYVSQGSMHDVRMAQSLVFEPKTIVVMDRAYTDYRLFEDWTCAGVFFVTRLKDNAAYKTIQRYPVIDGSGVKRDSQIKFTGSTSRKNCPSPLRRIEYWDAEQKRTLVFLTNIFHLSASTIALLYKERWQIEIFFRALKQLLPIRSFIGTSENAVQTQVWIALIAMLLIKFLHFRSRFSWSLSLLVTTMRMFLISNMPLEKLLDDPFSEISQLGKELFTLPLLTT